MALPSDKHGQRTERIFYPAFDGGLNLSVPPESLAKNELQEAINVEVSQDTGKLKVRGGLRFLKTLDFNVEEIIPIQGSNDFFILSTEADRTHKLHHYTDTGIHYTGLSLAPAVYDVKATIWDNSILIAYGNRVYENTFALTKITINDDGGYSFASIANPFDTEDYPVGCKFVFTHDSRVGTVDRNDFVKFSAIGDCNSWKNDPDDAKSGQFIEIGYKDGMEITAIATLSKDLIVFKAPGDIPDRGKIWRLVGNYPDWQVVEVARDTSTYNDKTIQVVDNDIFYLTSYRLASLSTVIEYGDVKTGWPDKKVASVLSRRINSNARLWHVRVKNQLWISIIPEYSIPEHRSQTIWVFDYSRGIWTIFEFPQRIKYVLCRNKDILVFINNNIYKLDESSQVDELRELGDRQVAARIKLGPVFTGRQTLIKNVYVSHEVPDGCSGELILGNFKMPFRGSHSRRQCLVRDWKIEPEIKMYGGGCSVSTLGLEIVEV